jgi:hypothetical protein
MRALRLLIAALCGGLLASAAGKELAGRVVDANTGEPVARAHVTIRFFQGNQPAPEVTFLSDADGSFRITNLPDGGYSVFCEKAGYLPSNQSMAGMGGILSANSGDAKPVTMVIKLTAQAAVEGTVVDDRDLPAENTFIQLLRQQVVNGRKQWISTGGIGTDETGFFRLFGLPAGHYYVSIMPRLNGARRVQHLAYPHLYYPNVNDVAAAQPIDLKAGDEAEIKIRLPEPVPAFEVRGVVATAAQNANMSLIRQPSNPNVQTPTGDLTFDARTKAFRFTHVTPGMYQLTATVMQDNRTSFATATVTVGSSDVTGIRLEPVEASLDGILRLEGDAPQQRPSGFVFARSDQYSNSGQVDAEGKFHIPNLQPGTYHIATQINSMQSCVQSVLSGGRDVRDGLTIAAGVALDPIEITLSSHCGSVDVSLTPSDAPLPPNLTAYLLRKAGDELTLERQGYRVPGSNDGTAHFNIQGVAPGEYIVYIWPQDLPIEWADAEYMKQFDSYGQKVTVTEDSKATVTLDKVITTTAKN